jgi:hypothetical protein
MFDALTGLGRAAIETCEAAGLTRVAATLGAPGLVDVDTGTLVFAPNLGWEEIQLTAELAARLGRPALHTMADNEATSLPRSGTTVGVPDGGVAALVERARAGDEATLDALGGRTHAGACAGDHGRPVRAEERGAWQQLRGAARLAPRPAPRRARAAVLRPALRRRGGRAVVTGAAAPVRGAAARALRTVCDDPLMVAAGG